MRLRIVCFDDVRAMFLHVRTIHVHVRLLKSSAYQHTHTRTYLPNSTIASVGRFLVPSDYVDSNSWPVILSLLNYAAFVVFCSFGCDRQLHGHPWQWIFNSRSVAPYSERTSDGAQ